MKEALVVLLRLRDDFDFDVLEREHADDLPPARHTATKEVLDYIDCCCHILIFNENFPHSRTNFNHTITLKD